MLAERLFGNLTKGGGVQPRVQPRVQRTAPRARARRSPKCGFGPAKRKSTAGAVLEREGLSVVHSGGKNRHRAQRIGGRNAAKRPVMDRYRANRASTTNDRFWPTVVERLAGSFGPFEAVDTSRKRTFKRPLPD